MTASQLPAAPAVASQNGLSRPERKQSTARITKSSTGYNFAAMPSPSQIPAQSGFLRAQASRPSAVHASTMKSQLIRPVVITAGAIAIIMASQGRDMRRCAHNTSRKNPNSSTAFTPTNKAAAWAIAELGRFGPVCPPRASVMRRARSIRAPVSTGYSTSALMNGTLPSDNPRA